MSAVTLSTYPQTVLTLSALSDKGTDNVGSATVARRRLRTLVRKVRIARSRGDLVAVILLQQRIRAELAR